jgi:hypothetical protein
MACQTERFGYICGGPFLPLGKVGWWTSLGSAGLRPHDEPVSKRTPAGYDTRSGVSLCRDQGGARAREATASANALLSKGPMVRSTMKPGPISHSTIRAGSPVRGKHLRGQAAFGAGCQRKPLTPAMMLEMPGSPSLRASKGRLDAGPPHQSWPLCVACKHDHHNAHQRQINFSRGSAS